MSQRRLALTSIIFSGVVLAVAPTYRSVDLKLELGTGLLSVSASNTASPTLGVNKPVVKDGVAYVSARHQTGIWNLGLSPKLPLALTVEQKSGNGELMLKGLPLNRLKIKRGSGPLELGLPSRNLVVNLSQETGSLDVFLPADTGLKLIVERFETGSLTLESQDIGVGSGLSGTYQTANFDAAKYKVTLNLNWGSGPVDIHTPGQD